MNKMARMLMINYGQSDSEHKDDGGYSDKGEYIKGGYSKWDGRERRDAYEGKENHHEDTRHAMENRKPVLTREIADRWMKSLKNEDGTTGPHWTMEQTKQVQAQRGIDCEPLEFWVAANVIYSDYCKVASDMGVNNMDFYAKMAKAWLDDNDSVDNKLSAYYDYVVEH